MLVEGGRVRYRARGVDCGVSTRCLEWKTG